MTDSEGPARSRILPALLTALGVMLLAVGLLTYTVPVSADPPAATPSASPSAAVATDEPLITLPPLGSVAPSASPSADPDRVSTRVRIAALGIDLPVVPPPGDASYPLLQRRDVDRRARAAGPGPRDVPLRPCADRGCSCRSSRRPRSRTARR